MLKAHDYFYLDYPCMFLWWGGSISPCSVQHSLSCSYNIPHSLLSIHAEVEGSIHQGDPRSLAVSPGMAGTWDQTRYTCSGGTHLIHRQENIVIK